MRTYRKSGCGSSPGMRFTPWSRVQCGDIKNGTLLGLVEREGFDIFLPGDKNMQRRQRLEGRSFAVLVLPAINWPVTPSMKMLVVTWSRLASDCCSK